MAFSYLIHFTLVLYLRSGIRLEWSLVISYNRGLYDNYISGTNTLAYYGNL
jgi:hypothetical protein